MRRWLLDRHTPPYGYEGTENAATCVSAHPKIDSLAVVGGSNGSVYLWHGEGDGEGGEEEEGDGEGGEEEEGTILVEAMIGQEWRCGRHTGILRSSKS